MAGLSTGTPTKTSPYGSLQGYGSAVPKTPVDPLLGSPGGQLAPGGAPASAPQATTDWFNTPKAGATTVPTFGGPVMFNSGGTNETIDQATQRQAQQYSYQGASALSGQSAAQTAALAKQQSDAAAAAQAAQVAETKRQEDLSYYAHKDDPYRAEKATTEARNAAVNVADAEANRQRTAFEALNAAGIESARVSAGTARDAATAEAERAAEAVRQQQGFSSSMLDKQVGVVKDLMGNPVGGAGSVTTPVPGSGEPAVATPGPLPRVGLGGTTSAAPVYGGGGVSEPGSRFETKTTPVDGATGGNPLQAADAAAWARAKDKIGGQTRGAITSLQGLQAARGFGGESGVYGDEERKLLGTGLSAMGDVTRGQAEDAAAAARAREAMVYQGDITQRGQDLGLTSNTMNIGLGERGQNISAANAAADRQAQLLGSYLSLIKFGAY